MPQFQSEEDNSAFLEGKAILGALNGNPNAISVADASTEQAIIGSKSLSPINVKHKNGPEHQEM